MRPHKHERIGHVRNSGRNTARRVVSGFHQLCVDPDRLQSDKAHQAVFAPIVRPGIPDFNARARLSAFYGNHCAGNVGGRRCPCAKPERSQLSRSGRRDRGRLEPHSIAVPVAVAIIHLGHYCCPSHSDKSGRNPDLGYFGPYRDRVEKLHPICGPAVPIRVASGAVNGSKWGGSHGLGSTDFDLIKRGQSRHARKYSSKNRNQFHAAPHLLGSVVLPRRARQGAGQ